MDDQNFDEQSAQDWISSVEAGTTRDQDIYPWLAAWVDRVNPTRILDIGCGQGICSDRINLSGRHYTGLDPSPFLLNRAQQLYPGHDRKFILGSLYQLPLADHQFQAAFAIAVWHLLEDLTLAATEMSRVLVPDGQFLIISANPHAYQLWTDFYADRKLEGERFTGTTRMPDGRIAEDILYLHSLEKIVDSLSAAKLVVQKIETFRASAKSPGQHQFIWIEGQKA